MAFVASRLGQFCENFENTREIYQIYVSFLCVCPVIDHDLRHNVVKVAVDYFHNAMTKFMNNNRTDARDDVIHASVLLLTIKFSQ